MNILELSEIQQLLFSIDNNTIEEICSILIRSDYLENIDKLNILLSNISLLIELRPRKIDSIIDLCILLNKFDPTNSFAIQLFKYLLNKLSQEQQYFIFKGNYLDLFPFSLISSSIEYLINCSQEKKAFSLARWFIPKLIEYNRILFTKIFRFSFLKPVEKDIYKQNRSNHFLLNYRASSKLPTEVAMFDILRNDNIEALKENIKIFSDVMMKKRHLLSIDSIYSQLTESSILLDENLSVFDICAYYNSIRCFEFLCSFVESGNKSKFLQSIYQEREKPFTVLHYAIAGGSIQIILSLINRKFPIEDCIQCAVYFHRNDLIDFFSEIDTETPTDLMKLLTSSKDVWGTPLFQSCHSNNIEILLQMIHYKSLQTSLNTPFSGPALSQSLTFPNPFFYNLNLYLYIYDNIIKSQKALESEDEKIKNESLFKFKNSDEAESSMSFLLSSVKFSKEMLINALFYSCKKGYSEVFELMIKELFETSRLTEKILSERPDHDHDDVFQFRFNLNVTDQSGNTLLILASKFNQTSCVKILLNPEQIISNLNENEINFVDINVNAFNNERRSALEYACFNGNNEIVNLLLSTGRTSIDNLHKSLILCLRSYSYCNDRSFREIYDFQWNPYMYFVNIYNLMYPFTFVNIFNKTACLSDQRKINKKVEISFDKIIRSLINALKQIRKSNILESSSSNDILSSSEELNTEPPFYFSMYLKTIEKYSIENDNLEIFMSLMHCPEALKSLTNARCVEIINDVINHNSINILKYIFSSLDKNHVKQQDFQCPIQVDTKENFLKTAILSNSFDVAEYLFKLGIFDLIYNDVFIVLRYPGIIRLIFEEKPDLIISNINKQGKIHQTLLTQSAISNFIDTFRFLKNLPGVNINAEGDQYDSINESYTKNYLDIFIMCMRHPTIDVNKHSFVAKKAMEKVIAAGDVISAKIILEKSKKELDLTEPIYYYQNDILDELYRYERKKPDCFMSLAINQDRKEIVEYFNHYLAVNNKKPYKPSSNSKEAPKTPQLKEFDLNVEQAILDNDLESLKKLINKDTINMKFERNGVTPLNTAIQIGNIEIVKYLLSQPDIDINLQNEVRNYNQITKYPRKTEYNIDQSPSFSKGIGETPLITAVKFKNKEIVQLLLAIPSIDINKSSGDESCTPLIQAIKGRGKKIFNPILNSQQPKKYGISNMTDEEKVADCINVQSIINMLIKFDGIDINKCSKSSSPLVEAASADQYETIKLMIDLFTDLPPDSKKTPLNLEIKATYGRTAINSTKDEDIKKILREKGAKEEPNRYGNKPASEPVRKQNSAIKTNFETPSSFLASITPDKTGSRINISFHQGKNTGGSFGNGSSNIANTFNKKTSETQNHGGFKYGNSKSSENSSSTPKQNTSFSNNFMKNENENQKKTGSFGKNSTGFNGFNFLSSTTQSPTKSDTKSSNTQTISVVNPFDGKVGFNAPKKTANADLNKNDTETTEKRNFSSFGSNSKNTSSLSEKWGNTSKQPTNGWGNASNKRDWTLSGKPPVFNWGSQSKDPNKKD